MTTVAKTVIPRSQAGVGSLTPTTANKDGGAIAWPDTNVKHARLKTKGRSVHVLLQPATGVNPRLVTTEADYLLTHGAVSGGDNAFTVGSYLRGVTSGAVAKIQQVLSGTQVRATMVFGSFTAETVNETTTGEATGDTGDSASVSAQALQKPDSKIHPRDGWVVIFNRDPSTNDTIALRTTEGTATVEVEPGNL